MFVVSSAPHMVLMLGAFPFPERSLGRSAPSACKSELLRGFHIYYFLFIPGKNQPRVVKEMSP